LNCRDAIRLTLTSRTADQPEAWQAYAEGRDMAVTVKPAAHPQGSTVEVLDLFFNTPARRKFMRTEKTEFTHIDEVVRRIALARFDVAINLSHNGKLVRQYRAVKDSSQNSRRLASICSSAFVEHALEVEWQHGDLAIRGWVADPVGSRTLTDMQYCYVNNRMMKDRLINHAIRQAYQEQLKDDQQPAFVLYLDVDPHQVDVNVHPAKHEVRFHQSRLVHDFIYQAVVSVLQQAGNPALPETSSPDALSGEPEAPVARWQPENRQAAGGNHFSQPAERTTARTAQPNVFPETSRVSHLRETTTGYAGKQEGESYSKPQGELYQRLLRPAPEVYSQATPATTSSQTIANPIMPTPATPRQNTSLSAGGVVSDSVLEGHSQSLGRVLTICAPSYALLERAGKLVLLSLPVAERWLKRAQLTPDEQGLKPQPLLIPVKLTLTKEESAAFNRHHALLQKMGIEMLLDHQRATLRTVPLPLRQQNLQKLIPDLLGYLTTQQEMIPDAVAMPKIDAQPEMIATLDTIAIWLARHLASEHEVWTISQAIQLLTEVERLCPQLVKSPPSGLLQPVDLQPALAAFKHD